MRDRNFWIQGLAGQVHDGRWFITRTSERLAIQLCSGRGHDLQDLAESMFCVLLRIREVADHDEVTVRVGGTELAMAAETRDAESDEQRGWGVEAVLAPSDLLGLLESGSQLTAAGGGEGLTVAISARRGEALSDEADLIGALLLRDVDSWIASAKVPGRRSIRPAATVLQPYLPVDAHLLTADDPRIRDLIHPYGDLRELVRSLTPLEWDRAHEALELVSELREELNEATIEDEAASVLRSLLGERISATWAKPMARRFGLDGRKATLDEVAKDVGVTRERVRQVQSKLALPRSPIWAPSMDAAMTLIDHTVPCTVTELAEALRAADLSDLDNWSATALSAAAALTGRSVQLVEADGFVGRPGQVAAAGAVLPAARAASSLLGIATVRGVLDRLTNQSKHADDSMVKQILVESPEVHWISDQWFWTDHPPSRNRLVNTSLRILAVIQPQRLEDMHEGVARHYRWRSSSGAERLLELAAPEPSVLAAFYESHPAFAFDSADQTVTALRPVDIESLGVEKLAMVGVLRSQPFGVMDRNSLIDACREVGMKGSTAGIFITYAECIKNFGHNVWGLRGSVVPDDVVLSTQRRARATRQNHDRRCVMGATATGRLWMARKVTPTFLNSGVMPFDWGKKQLADRKLAAVDMVDGEPVGALRFVKGFNYGYVPYLSKHRLSVGDVIRVLADPESDTCHIESGGDELLSEPFDF